MYRLPDFLNVPFTEFQYNDIHIYFFHPIIYIDEILKYPF